MAVIRWSVDTWQPCRPKQLVKHPEGEKGIPFSQFDVANQTILEELKSEGIPCSSAFHRFWYKKWMWLWFNVLGNFQNVMPAIYEFNVHFD